MDKQTYKEMLADEATKVSELQNEINKLCVMAYNYMKDL